MYLVLVLEYTCYKYFRDIGSKVGSFVKYLVAPKLIWNGLSPSLFLDVPPSPPRGTHLIYSKGLQPLNFWRPIYSLPKSVTKLTCFRPNSNIIW